VLATSAVRESVSRQEFARQVEAATGVPLTIVSGEVEARLAAAGVRADPAYQAYADILSFDLGGGSLEVSVLRGQRCVLARSFPLGSVRLTHGFLRGGHGPVDELDQLSIRTHLLASLQTVVPAGAAEKFLIVGAGGVFAAVALHLEALGEAPVGGRLPLLRIRELRDRMCAADLAGRRAIPGIPAERADIMPAALITLCVLADLTGAEAFHLSHYGVRHGMVELLLGPSGEHL
jgi:exopolyphosphatase/guanosine-5'-triphosphate,3'-diphosphate pyrophosphatase